MTDAFFAYTVVLYDRIYMGDVMGKHGWKFVSGAVMIIGGLVMFFALLGVETPIVGLRQAGLVIAVLGAGEMVTTVIMIRRARRPQRK
ncbi:hypothetical protein GCM10025779_08270 [Arthrobacter cryoconiti]